MDKCLISIKIDAPQVGKYFYAYLNYSHRDKEWYHYLCYCTAAYNQNDQILLIVNTQDGTEYKITQDKIVKEVIVDIEPQYRIGQTVKATVKYANNESLYDYCFVEKIFQFCNNVSYELMIIKENKKIIVSEMSIQEVASLKKPVYNIGERIGIKIYYPNNDYTIKNGIITNIHQWYTSVSYDVLFEDNTIQEKVYEGYITEPYTQPPPIDIKKLLKTREQELIEELEQIRNMMEQ